MQDYIFNYADRILDRKIIKLKDENHMDFVPTFIFGVYLMTSIDLGSLVQPFLL